MLCIWMSISPPTCPSPSPQLTNCLRHSFQACGTGKNWGRRTGRSSDESLGPASGSPSPMQSGDQPPLHVLSQIATHEAGRVCGSWLHPGQVSAEEQHHPSCASVPDRTGRMRVRPWGWQCSLFLQLVILTTHHVRCVCFFARPL